MVWAMAKLAKRGYENRCEMEEVEQGNQMPLKPTEMLEEVISELKSHGFDLDEMENQRE